MDPALDRAPCGYLQFNDKGVICVTNLTLCELLGYTREEMSGIKFEQLLTVPGKIFVQTHFYPLIKMQGKAEEIFLTLLARTGVAIPVLINATRSETDPPMNICVAVPVHNRRKYEDEILEAKYQATKALQQNDQLNKAREEAFQYSREADRQITRLRQVNEDLLQFSTIINHDMQECIRKINTFSILAKTDDANHYLGKISETALRLKLINSSLNMFIQLGAAKENFQNVDLNSVVEKSKNEVLKSTGFQNLHFSCEPLPQVDGIEDQLRLLFFHLLLNAVKFRKGDSSTITISAVTYEENSFKNTSDRYHYGEVVRIIIADDGIGFDDQYKEYVMGILKKMQVHSGGSGIGLALCKRVVDNHYGEIHLRSELNKGTKVILLLPLKQDPRRKVFYK